MSRSRWDIMAPNVRLGFSPGPYAAKLQVELGKIPGLKRRGGGWLVPGNAISVVATLCSRFSTDIVYASWHEPPPGQLAWGQVMPQLIHGGEVRAFVLDGFLTDYQREAVAFGWPRSGVHFWHMTGCLTGDTKLTVNRGGKAFCITLKDLVHKFNGGESGRWGKGYKWDPALETRTASEDGGYLRLNTIEAAFSTGEKEVFLLRTAAGHEIKATADHRFLLPDGTYARLGELAVGAVVCAKGLKSRRAKKPKAQYRLRGVRYHPYAQVTQHTLNEATRKRQRRKPGATTTLYRVPHHRLVAEARLNDVGVEDLVRRCRRGQTEGLVFLDPAEVAVHHKNHDPKDNRPENLEVMPHEAHLKLHRALASRGLYDVRDAEVVSIEPAGTEETYDLTMKTPHNNYVANGLVVHNSGKTLTGLLTALSIPGPVVVITRASARLQFAREIERFTTLKPYVIRPESERRGLMTVNGLTWVDFFKLKMPELGKAALVADAWKAAKAHHGVLVKKGNSLAGYLKDCWDARTRPVVVLGWESLAQHYDAIADLAPSTIIFDELHQGKSSKRYTVMPLPDPSQDIEERRDQVQEENRLLREYKGIAGRDAFVKQTDEGRKMFVPVMNRAAAAAGLARLTRKRIGLTATPVKDRVRDLYAQLDTIEPNAWGNATAWLTRHADRKPGTYGGYDTRGSSNLDELKERLESTAHILDYHQTHQHLPPKRRQSVYIAPADQCRPTGGFAKERRDARKRGPTAVLEVGLAEAASRKRPAVIGLIEDHLICGQKVVVFTGRRRDCEALGKSVRSARGVKAAKATVWTAHGGDSHKVRDEIIRDYMAHPGPCILVGTGPAFGESLNIDDTDAALFVMLPYTPGQLRQWEGRFHRASSKKPVIIYYIVAEGTVDEHLAAILIDKLPAVEKVVGDKELGEAKGPLAGFDPNETDEAFAEAILADLDFG